MRGAPAFTLDAVAEAAGVSKGGLMYHFPSKEALLEALVARAVDAVDAALAPAAHSSEPGAFTRAYLEITVPVSVEAGLPPAVDGPPSPNLSTSPNVSTSPNLSTSPLAALTVAVAVAPTLLDPLRAAYARWQARLEADGIDPAAATAVRLAVDGWWMAALLDLPALSTDIHHRTRALLQRLALPPPKPGAQPTLGSRST